MKGNNEKKDFSHFWNEIVAPLLNNKVEPLAAKAVQRKIENAMFDYAKERRLEETELWSKFNLFHDFQKEEGSLKRFERGCF
jgi:hypothetical protein